MTGYARAVRTLLAKLLLLAAVLLMPIGMSPAIASSEHHAHGATMPVEHCPEQAPAHSGKTGFVECTMACAAALPAAHAPAGMPPMIVSLPVEPATAERLHGVHPDTATPPPKLS